MDRYAFYCDCGDRGSFEPDGYITDLGQWVRYEDALAIRAAALEEAANVTRPPNDRGPTARPLDEYHEDYGFVVWWKFPVNEPSWIGSPSCDDWPGYHTHWTPHPEIPVEPS